MIFALAEELREVLKKDVDIFEINEINKDSDFYNAIEREAACCMKYSDQQQIQKYIKST